MRVDETRPAIDVVGQRRLIDIVSGSFGAGHDAAAREIARHLESQGFTTRIWDIVDLLPGPLGRGLRAAYLRQMHAAPSSWGWVLRRLQRRPFLVRLICGMVQSSGAALQEIADDQPTLIIATHPFASQALGHLRATDRLHIPVVTYLTDMSVHRLWVNDSVDLHLALHEIPALQAHAQGAQHVRVVRPAVPDVFARTPHDEHAQTAARHLIGLPLYPRLVLIAGGSQGVGDLEQAAKEISETQIGFPVVLCGHNDRLRRRIESHRSAIALGWVEDMQTLYAAVDVVVQNAGGITSLEALTAGLPVVSYRCLPGHGETNAEALARAGLVPWVRQPAELAAALTASVRNGNFDQQAAVAQLFRAMDVADAIQDEVRVAL
jgi:processive 1,2-diacylglycerol beta-glucosyltransferase